MITTIKWRNRNRLAFGVSFSPGLFHVHGFGWSFELEWGDRDKGADWVRRNKLRGGTNPPPARPTS